MTDFFGHYFNDTIFQLYLGGLFSLLLAVTIVYVKQFYKRSIERKRLEQAAQDNAFAVGDIDANLDDSFEFQKPNFGQQLVVWGIQPLFIICFINLFAMSGEPELIIAFAFLIFTIFHEFIFAERYSKNIRYQLIIIVFWLATFFIFSYRTSKQDALKKTQTAGVHK